ncbi:GNAT family N-acetyltransferase [Rhodococcus sp. Z13]|uniref:GNAT family N-acetyltransferase n=1 Tax=Rhodococcus sacchari TaxID=2962047 RepID=A0ACD4DHV4_9NOCA|nr:GNAT family N-acetyltransferase [Rhodococcus sp. Z13]UYP19655.1 GNAT family N-acetyltransferase [Rhodococcus sp. Z13]
MPSVHHAPLRKIDPESLYRIVALRTDVFVHEQGITCEPELDGRDLEPTTELFWTQEGDEVLATLRVLHDSEDIAHIGRVATARHTRGRGLAGELLEAALATCPGIVDISAQAHLENWYARFGFVRTGPNYIEAGIDHVPMRRSR